MASREGTGPGGNSGQANGVCTSKEPRDRKSSVKCYKKSWHLKAGEVFFFPGFCCAPYLQTTDKKTAATVVKSNKLKNTGVKNISQCSYIKNWEKKVYHLETIQSRSIYIYYSTLVLCSFKNTKLRKLIW